MKIWGGPGNGAASGNVWEPSLSSLQAPQASYAPPGCGPPPALQEQWGHDGEHPWWSPAIPSGAFGDLISKCHLPFCVHGPCR